MRIWFFVGLVAGVPLGALAIWGFREVRAWGEVKRVEKAIRYLDGDWRPLTR